MSKRRYSDTVDSILEKYGKERGILILHLFYAKTLFQLTVSKEKKNDEEKRIEQLITKYYGKTFAGKYKLFDLEHSTDYDLVREIEIYGGSYEIFCHFELLSDSFYENIAQKETINKETDYLLFLQRHPEYREYSNYGTFADTVQEAEQLSTKGEYEKAIKAYKKVLFLEPSLENHLKLGKCFLACSEYQNAIKTFKKAPAYSFQKDEVVLEMVRALCSYQLYDDAKKLIETYLDKYPYKRGTDEEKRLISPIYYGNFGERVSIDSIVEATRKQFNLQAQLETSFSSDEIDDFCTSALFFCRKHYADLDNLNFGGKYIMLSYFGALCLSCLQMEEKEILSGHLFGNLCARVDLESIESSAENLLQSITSSHSRNKFWDIVEFFVSRVYGLEENNFQDSQLVRLAREAFYLSISAFSSFYQGK